MRTAYINCAYGAASTGRLVADLVNYGNAHGHECIAFYSEWHSDAPEAHRYIRDGEPFRSKVERCKALLRDEGIL